MTAEPFLDAAQRMFNPVSNWKDDIQLTHPDLGGGFGVAYQPEEPLDKSFYLKELVKLAENYPQITLVLEPGRAITADAGVLLTTVEYIKPSEDKNFVLVDAGMNDLIRPSLYQPARHFTRARK